MFIEHGCLYEWGTISTASRMSCFWINDPKGAETINGSILWNMYMLQLCIMNTWMGNLDWDNFGEISCLGYRRISLNRSLGGSHIARMSRSKAIGWYRYFGIPWLGSLGVIECFGGSCAISNIFLGASQWRAYFQQHACPAKGYKLSWLGVRRRELLKWR